MEANKLWNAPNEGAGVCIDWDRDDVFVLRYQALDHARGQMTGDALANTQKWLEENEGRYLRLTKKL